MRQGCRSTRTAATAMLAVVAMRAEAAAPDLRYGNGYLQACTAEDPMLSVVTCGQYTMGMDGMLMALQIGDHTQPNECTTGDATVQQKIDVLVKFLRDNPNVRHLPTPPLYLLALERAFPCVTVKPLPQLDKQF
jgi:hypothetical protein